MNRITYPAIFHESQKDEQGYWITFPDFEYIVSEGNTIDEAYNMAIDALGLALTTLDKNETAPAPSPATKIKLAKGEQIVLINFDLDEYIKKQNSKPVKKTLSIPGWLNEKAIAAGVNFSAVLQEALKAKLGL